MKRGNRYKGRQMSQVALGCGSGTQHPANLLEDLPQAELS